MEKFVELLDKLEEQRGLTDYKAAQILKIEQQRLSAYRKGKESPDAYACTRLAVELGIDPMTLIAQVEAEKAKNPEKRRFWRDFFRHAVHMSVTAALIFTAFWCNVPDSYAAGLLNGAKSLTKNAIIRSKAAFKALWVSLHCATYCTKWQCY